MSRSVRISKLIVTLAGVVGAALLSGWLAGSSRAERAALDQVAALRVELARAKTDRGEERFFGSGLAASASERAAASKVEPSPPDRPTRRVKPMSVEERKRYNQALHRAQAELLANAFDGEAVDGPWRAEAESQLHVLYSGEEFRALNLRAECRTSLCRIDFSYDDANAASAAIRRLIERQPWPGRAYTQYDTDRKAGFAYLTRKGSSFPRVDPDSIVL